HQAQRDRDDSLGGSLVATLPDYAVARELLLAPVQLTLGMKSDAAPLYENLKEAYGDNEFSSQDVQRLEMHTPESTVYEWMAELRRHGCIDMVKPSRGPHPAIWRLNGRTPEDTLLPMLGMNPEKPPK